MKFIYLLTALIMSAALIAQKEGSIVYEETVKLDIKLPEGMEEMMAKMPKERTTVKVLHFNENESLYLPKKDKIGSEDDEISMGGDGFQFKFKMNEPDNRTYINRAEQTLTHKQDLLGKAFLIEKPIPKYSWKIGNEMQKVGEYVCMKASATLNDTTEIVAWFSSEIPIALGPQEYQGLPGAILALEVNEDERILVATKVNLGTLEEGLIEKPTKGKKVSQEEFDDIRKKKMAEMQAEHGGRGVHIITRND